MREKKDPRTQFCISTNTIAEKVWRHNGRRRRRQQREGERNRMYEKLNDTIILFTVIYSKFNTSLISS